MAVITGTAYFAYIDAPRTEQGKSMFPPSNKFELVVGDLSNVDIDKVKALGTKAKINHDDEKGFSVSLKNTNRPPLIDINKDDLPLETIVGNGSKVKVMIGTYENKFGKFIDWKKTMVLKLEGRDSEVDDSEFDEESGTETEDEVDPFGVIED